ncbi:hypothetical protein J6590_097943 [Homalodisca vitripennis]|nr:hypothetical protein J6590_097943 [Homalodisca vitripennis]
MPKAVRAMQHRHEQNTFCLIRAILCMRLAFFFQQKPMCHLNLGNLMDVQERQTTNRKRRDSGVHGQFNRYGRLAPFLQRETPAPPLFSVKPQRPCLQPETPAPPFFSLKPQRSLLQPETSAPPFFSLKPHAPFFSLKPQRTPCSSRNPSAHFLQPKPQRPFLQPETPEPTFFILNPSAPFLQPETPAPLSSPETPVPPFFSLKPQPPLLQITIAAAESAYSCCPSPFARPWSLIFYSLFNFRMYEVNTSRTRRHRTGVYEHLPSQAGIRFINKLPDQLRNAPTLKVLKTRLRRFLVSQAFYSADEFMAFDWVTAQLAN